MVVQDGVEAVPVSVGDQTDRHVDGGEEGPAVGEQWRSTPELRQPSAQRTSVNAHPEVGRGLREAVDVQVGEAAEAMALE